MTMIDFVSAVDSGELTLDDTTLMDFTLLC